MPSSTAVYEILFEFNNDDTGSVAISIPKDDGEAEYTLTDALVWLKSREVVKLICTAGSTYHYVVRRGREEAKLAVKIWADTTCKTSDIFPSGARHNHRAFRSPQRGVTITVIAP